MYIIRSFLATTLIILSLPIGTGALQVADLHVRDLILDKTSYAQGETVHGTATITNGSPESISDAIYVVRLVGEFEGGTLPKAEYIASSSAPIFIKGASKKSISFELVLPPGVAGTDLAVEIQAQTSSGIPLGWQDARIKVSGSASLLSIESAEVLVGDSSFMTEAGPTVHQGETASLVVSLSNHTKNSQMLTPVVTVYDRTVDSGALLNTMKGETADIPSGKSFSNKFALPDFNRKPGVYAGTLEMRDASGVSRIPKLTFRYIVAGGYAVIQAVHADKSAAQYGETVKVTVAFTGSPPDIIAGTTAGSAPGMLQVSLFDEKGNSVASASTPIDINKDVPVDVPLTLQATALALRADIAILSKGVVVASTSVPLSAAYDVLANEAVNAQRISGEDEPVFPFTAFAALGLLIVIVLYVGLKLVRANGSAAAPLLLIPFLALGGLFPFSAQAFTVTEPVWTAPGYQAAVEGADIFVNTPNGTLTPGQTFYVEGSMSQYLCLNRGEQVYLEGTFQGEKKTYTNRRGVTGHFFQSISDRFSFGPFVAPSEAGTYRVYVGGYYFGYHRNGASSGAGSYGYQEFTVVNPCRPVNFCSGNDLYYGDPSNSSCTQTLQRACTYPLSAGCSAGGCLPPPGPSYKPITISVTTNSSDSSAVSGFTGDDSGRGTRNGMSDSSVNGHLLARPPLVKKGESSRLYWNAINVTRCTVSAPNGDLWTTVSGNTFTSGALGKNTGALQGQTTYTLSCTGLDGSTLEETALINIIPTFQEK